MRRISRVLTTALAAATVAGALLPITAEAHAIWFAQRAKQLALIYGVGADDLDMVKRLPKINSVAGYDADGNPVKTTLRAAGAIPVVDSEEPLAITAAAMDYGMWTRDKEGEFQNKGLDEVPGGTDSQRSMKYAVYLNQMPTKPLPMIPGHRLQLVPSGAIPLMMGQPVKLRALYDGKPRAGVLIKWDLVNDPDSEGVLTDADGYATINVRNQGNNVIEGVFKGPTDAPTKYAHIEHSATLTFVLPHKPE